MLRLVLASAGGNDVPWDVSVDGGVIVISAAPLAAAPAASVAGQTARTLHAQIERLEFDLKNANLDVEASEIELKRQMQKLKVDEAKFEQTMQLARKHAVTPREVQTAEQILEIAKLDVRTKEIDVERAQITRLRIKAQLNTAKRSLEAMSSGVLPETDDTPTSDDGPKPSPSTIIDVG